MVLLVILTWGHSSLEKVLCDWGTTLCSQGHNRGGQGLSGTSTDCVRSVAHLYLTLCGPMDCSPPASSVQGISQARILEWVAISFSRGSSRPRDPPTEKHHINRSSVLFSYRPPAPALHHIHSSPTHEPLFCCLSPSKMPSLPTSPRRTPMFPSLQDPALISSHQHLAGV